MKLLMFLSPGLFFCLPVFPVSGFAQNIEQNTDNISQPVVETATKPVSPYSDGGYNTTAFEEVHPLSEGLALVKQDGKMGYINSAGEIVIAPSFEKAAGFQNDLAAVGIFGRWGYIDKNGRIVIAPKYDEWNYFKGETTEVKYRGRWIVIDRLGKILKTKQALNLFDSIADGMRVFEDSGKFGYKDLNGKVIVPARFDDIYSFSEGMAPVEIEGKWGFVNKNGEVVINPVFEGVYPFKEGLAGACSNGKWGFVNEKGENVIESKFDDVQSFSEGLAGFKSNFKWGYIDKFGKEVITPKYESAFPFSSGTARVLSMEKCNCPSVFIRKTLFIDRDGNLLFESLSKDLKGIERIITADGKYGYAIDGKVVIPPVYQYASDFADELASVIFKGKYGFIDAHGNFVVLPYSPGSETIEINSAMDKVRKCFDVLNSSRTGTATVLKKRIRKGIEEYWDYDKDILFNELHPEEVLFAKSGNLWALLSADGRIVGKPRYDDVKKFAQRLAPAKIQGKWGYIDKNGNWVIPAQYDEAFPFNSAAAARVKKDGNYFFINPEGKTSDIYKEGEELLLFKKGEKWGFTDLNGNVVIEPGFEDSALFHKGLCAVKHEDKWGYMDTAGNFVIKPEYGFAGSFSSEDIAMVKETDTVEFIDRSGMVVSSENIKTENLIYPVKMPDGKSGYADSDSNALIMPQYDRAESFKNGMALVEKDSKTSFIDRTGNAVYEILDKTNDSFMRAGNSEGRIVYFCKEACHDIPVSDEFKSDFSDGAVAVNSEGKWGLLWNDGKFIVSPQFDEPVLFSSGTARTSLNGKHEVLNINGDASDRRSYVLAVDTMAETGIAVKKVSLQRPYVPFNYIRPSDYLNSDNDAVKFKFCKGLNAKLAVGAIGELCGVALKKVSGKIVLQSGDTGSFVFYDLESGRELKSITLDLNLAKGAQIPVLHVLSIGMPRDLRNVFIIARQIEKRKYDRQQSWINVAYKEYFDFSPEITVGKKRISEWVNVLNSENPADRAMAVEALKSMEIQSVRFIPEILKIFQHENPLIGRSAFNVLKFFAGIVRFPPEQIKELLEHRNPRVRRDAMYLVGYLNDKYGIASDEAVLKMSLDENPAVRFAANQVFPFLEVSPSSSPVTSQ